IFASASSESVGRLHRLEKPRTAGNSPHCRRNCFSRNASAISEQPCRIANEAMTHTRASAPAPGRAISKTPKAIESRPLRINHFTFELFSQLDGPPDPQRADHYRPTGDKN